MEWNVDMNQVVGSHHIVFLCLDALRYDVAKEAEKMGTTPCINSYGSWIKCQAVGNFTYPAHQAMFAGFFPCASDAKNHRQRISLFFPENVGMGRKAPEGVYGFRQENFIKALEEEGYTTCCIGGVSFFDKRPGLGSVLPVYFQQSFWNPSFAPVVPESTENQVNFAIRWLSEQPEHSKIFLYMNISAIHYPNYFYRIGNSSYSIKNTSCESHSGGLEYIACSNPPETESSPRETLSYYLEQADGRLPVPAYGRDTKESHAAALCYVDSQLGRLFSALKEQGETFVICCSDHGTCYGEDGCYSHGINHPMVNTIPYQHFFL